VSAGELHKGKRFCKGQIIFVEDMSMRSTKPKLLMVCIVAALLVGLVVSPAQAARVLWQAAGTDIYLNRPFNTLEFEDPTAVGKYVDTYRILDWRDADYGGVPTYDEWTVSDSNQIDGNINEIWMRNNTHSIWTTTASPSNVVSIHLNGDNNDGIAEVLVDGIVRARIDMGVRGNPQTALVIVKFLPWVVHNVLVRDAGLGPSRLGDDVATLGAAALGARKWYPRYWYLDGRIRLIRTYDRYGLVIPVTVPNGYWGGWWWWHHQCTWFWPWYGGIGWYWPYYYNYPYWQYWNYWPYYRYYAPWWRNWQWRGGPWFWGFKKCLTYRYYYPMPRILYWWSWYWDPSGQGNCAELVTMADESNPAGGRVLPVEEEVISNLTVDSHEFSVNADDANGTFTNLEWVTIGTGGSGLRSQFMSMTGADMNETDAFMESEIVQQLLANSEGHPSARVGLQYASWSQGSIAPKLNITAESIVLNEGTGYTYDVNLPSSPGLGQTVNVTITPSSESVQLGSGGYLYPPGESLILNFNEYNWNTPQHVDVNAVNDTDARGDNETVLISHSLTSTNSTFDRGGVSLEVTVQDDEPGGLGFVQSDLNHDGKVNFTDFATMANEWLSCTDPMQP